MNTTAAAIQAKVTVATIRTWCRRGVIAAAKVAGKWVIDTASLARRIEIGARKTRKAKTLPQVIEALLALGGRRWQKNGMDRIYLNNWHEYAGLELTYYNSGNISSASLGGRGIANGRAYKIAGLIEKLYFDVTDGHLHVKQYGATEVEVRYLDGERDYVDLVARTFAGVRAAIAAL
jgi:hypothetical protein